MCCLCSSLAPTGDKYKRWWVLCIGKHAGYYEMGASTSWRIQGRLGAAFVFARGWQPDRPCHRCSITQARSRRPLQCRSMGKGPEDGCLTQIQSLGKTITLSPMSCFFVSLNFRSTAFRNYDLLLWVKVDLMSAVEKDGMKLYDKVGQISGGESTRLQTNLEDLVAHVGPIFLHTVFRH